MQQLPCMLMEEINIMLRETQSWVRSISFLFIMRQGSWILKSFYFWRQSLIFQRFLSFGEKQYFQRHWWGSLQGAPWGHASGVEEYLRWVSNAPSTHQCLRHRPRTCFCCCDKTKKKKYTKRVVFNQKSLWKVQSKEKTQKKTLILNSLSMNCGNSSLSHR